MILTSWDIRVASFHGVAALRTLFFGLVSKLRSIGNALALVGLRADSLTLQQQSSNDTSTSGLLVHGDVGFWFRILKKQALQAGRRSDFKEHFNEPPMNLSKEPQPFGQISSPKKGTMVRAKSWAFGSCKATFIKIIHKVFVLKGLCCGFHCDVFFFATCQFCWWHFWDGEKHDPGLFKGEKVTSN